MILTKEIFESGKSVRGGINKKQMVALGAGDYMQNSGWYRRIIGKDYDPVDIQLFLSLKDAHLTKERIQHAELSKKHVAGSLRFEPVFNAIPYADQYLHPNWQKMRLYVLKRDNFTCVNCRSKDKTLHAHHIKYLFGKFIWEVPPYYIVTLCEDCHSEEHNRDLRASKR